MLSQHIHPQTIHVVNYSRILTMMPIIYITKRNSKYKNLMLQLFPFSWDLEVAIFAPNLSKNRSYNTLHVTYNHSWKWIFWTIEYLILFYFKLIFTDVSLFLHYQITFAWVLACKILILSLLSSRLPIILKLKLKIWVLKLCSDIHFYL